MENKKRDIALIFLLVALLGSSTVSSKYFDLRWNYTTKGAVTSAYVDDLDGDGFKDVIASAIEDSAGLGGSVGWVYLLTKEGNLVWYKTTEGLISSMIVDDMNGDGKKDAIAGVSYGVFYFDGSGEAIKTYLAEHIYKAEQLIAEDINNDGKKELVVAGTSSDGGKVFAFDGDKKRIWGSPETMGSLSSIYVGDINRDGLKEIIVGTVGKYDEYPGYVQLFNYEGKLVWTYKAEKGVQSVSAYDINGDGSSEILVGGTNYFKVLDEKSNLLQNISILGRVRKILVTDLDMDGSKEILLGSTQLYALDKNYNKKWVKDLRIEIDEIKTLDINDDGMLELVVAAKNLYFIDKDGKELEVYAGGNPKFYARSIEIADLSGDDYPEIIVSSLDRRIHVLWSQIQANRMDASRLLSKAAGLLEKKNYTGAEEYARDAKEVYVDMKDSTGAEKANKLLSDIINAEAASSETRVEAEAYYNQAYEAYISSDFMNATIYARQAKAKFQTPELNDVEGVSRCNNIINGAREYLETTAEDLALDAEKALGGNEYQKALEYSQKSLEYYTFLKDDNGTARSQAIVDESRKALGAPVSEQQAAPTLDQNSALLILLSALLLIALSLIILRMKPKKRKKKRLHLSFDGDTDTTDTKPVEEIKKEEKKSDKRVTPTAPSEDRDNEPVLGVMDDIDRDEKRFRHRRPLAKISKDSFRGLGLSLRGLMPYGAEKESIEQPAPKEKEQDLSD